MLERPEQVVECDVLILGGAAAGLTAAIEARQRGLDVLVADKGKAGRSGNTVVAGVQMSAVIPYEGSDDSPERHFEDTLAGGKGINDEALLRTLVTRGGPQLLKGEEWGVRLARWEGELIRRRPPGHTRARGIPTDQAAYRWNVGGLSITLPLRAQAESMGVRFVDEMPVVRLLAAGEACGALALDLRREQLVRIKARAVVVATGGAGLVFARTNNARGICGDAYGMLLQAGVPLKDMEFVQFYPLQMTVPFKYSFSNAVVFDGAVLRNRHGERFMHLYDPVNGETATRDKMAEAMFYELRKGNGIDGDLYMDATGMSEEVLQQRYAVLVRDLRRQGIDPKRDWLRVGPTTHFFMGGALVDDRCRTEVPGLFAAGEATGGVHGANRLSGNALTEAVVFGAVAGEAAAEYAARRTRTPEPPAEELALDAAGTGQGSLDEVRAELRRAMWKGSGIVRSGEALQEALSAVKQCASEVERYAPQSVAQAARREETRRMALTAEAVVLSALARLESRGSHVREDFPALDDRWLGSHHVRLAGERLEVAFVPKTK